ncbi:MAG TPA: tRNA dihydrouridine(20/20a) synthase DusA [Nevskiales bacterium]|nr:tRNA dihydrouridine(20/20a) synthase DusA [Nevskiales bacterium]
MHPRRICVAPMMDWTDRHDRYFLRLITRHARLYTEMVTADALLHGDRDRLLRFDAAERPLALQLGGSDPQKLARCARIAADWGYDEVNLNVGCPSDRVQSGRFGACLMAEPALVAECVAAMQAATSLPVTVKTRLGIDELDQYAHLHGFVTTVAQAGCRVFIIHARKAWLQGLSPRENREIPPLHYDRVYRLKQDFPELEIVLNGGVTTLDEAAGHLEQVDGVMLGRAAYQNPYLLAGVDARFYGDPAAAPTRLEIVERLLPYVERELARGTALKHIARHILGLFQGQPRARAWRRHLAEHAHRAGAGVEVLQAALACVQPALDAAA